MKLTHEGITATEKSLGAIAAKHGGTSDGWGVLHE
ncbi:MAG: ribonuclease E inhibitor RraB [Planctomycetes bacterium]|nr:ribonuclease E inhibitor RraB [Planctomycetota bacterium]